MRLCGLDELRRSASCRTDDSVAACRAAHACSDRCPVHSRETERHRDVCEGDCRSTAASGHVGPVSVLGTSGRASSAVGCAEHARRDRPAGAEFTGGGALAQPVLADGRRRRVPQPAQHHVARHAVPDRRHGARRDGDRSSRLAPAGSRAAGVAAVLPAGRMACPASCHPSYRPVPGDRGPRSARWCPRPVRELHVIWIAPDRCFRPGRSSKRPAAGSRRSPAWTVPICSLSARTARLNATRWRSRHSPLRLPRHGDW